MSTRSVIARPDGDGFAGTYAHWDGYPTCRGRQLWQTMQELDSIHALRDYAIREGSPGYWSSYQAPSTALEEAKKPAFIDEPCNLCNATGTRADWKTTCGFKGCNGCNSTGTRRRTYGDGVANQGWVEESSLNWVTSSGDDMGTEWAYVLGDAAMFIYERRYGNPADDQGHGTGMFGMGASDTESGGYWAFVAEIPWDGDEPNWDVVENATEVEEGKLI